MLFIIPLRLLDCLGLVMASTLVLGDLCVLEVVIFFLEAPLGAAIVGLDGSESGERRKAEGEGIVIVSIETWT